MEQILPDILKIDNTSIEMLLGDHVIVLKPYNTTSIKGDILVHFSMDGVHKGSECFGSLGAAVDYVLGK